jgi:hypothetical protein
MAGVTTTRLAHVAGAPRPGYVDTGSDQCCYRISKDTALAYVTPHSAAFEARLAGHPCYMVSYGMRK